MFIRRKSRKIAFLDILLNLLVCLCVIIFLLNANQNKADIKTKAEFVVTVTWPDDSHNDVDTWIQDPIGNILFFRQKEVGLMHLDRDDLGHVNDIITLDNGKKIEFHHNQELSTIRGFISGEWILNIHMYARRDPEPIEVEIKIDKLNPRVRMVFCKKITMSKDWEEITVTRFTMNGKGEIINWDDLPKPLVKSPGRVVG